MLVTERYDLGLLITSNSVLHDLALETFFGSPRRLWVPAQHRLLEKADVTLTDVAAEPYIMLTVDESAYTTLNFGLPRLTSHGSATHKFRGGGTQHGCQRAGRHHTV